MVKKKTLSEQVMEKIKAKKISMKSRYIFLAEKIGMRSVFAFTFLVVILFVNLLFYTLRSTGSLKFLSLGNVGFLAFFEAFPYEWVFLSAIFFILLSYFWKKFDFGYKYSFQFIMFILVIMTLSCGIIFAFSGFNEKIQAQVQSGKLGIFKPLYQRCLGNGQRLGHGLEGNIESIAEDYLIVVVEDKEVKVIFNENTHFPDGKDFIVGQKIHSGGKWQDDKTFLSQGIRTAAMGYGMGPGQGMGRGMMRWSNQ